MRGMAADPTARLFETQHCSHDVLCEDALPVRRRDCAVGAVRREEADEPVHHRQSR